jgi:transglutaminase-like putative cysteine protease
MNVYFTRFFTFLLISVFSICFTISNAAAASFIKLEKPPLNEQWFGIYVDKDLVGFYQQKFIETIDGYQIMASGNVRMKVMGFSKEATTREIYTVGPNLALRSFEVENNLNGTLSRITGKKYDSNMRIKVESKGKTIEKNFPKLSGEVYPGPVLNIYPLLRNAAVGKNYKILTFDPEELKVKDVKISVIGHENAPNGTPSVKLRNNLYPFVNNDIWVDYQGNTLWESVRDDLVVTKSENPKSLGAFVSNVVISRKDLIYDFSLIRTEPSLKELEKLKGLSVEISGWNDTIPLLQEGGQQVEKSGVGRIIIRTGSAVVTSPDKTPPKPATINDSYLEPSDKIEANEQKIIDKVKEITGPLTAPEEIAKALTSWTSGWLKDSVDDGGSALSSIKNRYGNCQTHARLYTALARSAKIPTRFVSGLVAIEDKGFLYHSWAESWLGGHWVAIDPTYNQFPADPTHLKLFEGSSQEDMAPIISIIGKIRINVLETKL